ncbi:hypothetical protein DRJ17_04205 [Candidatus Woesearchaeota archaeon]|mgnify:CR=1 FL=1|nr:MAG: hypothetical protein DRJ17_04205 [Candidatus Woesearchaeota archaeon]
MTIKETLKKLDNGEYKNSREVVLGGVSYSVREILIKAPLLAGINVYLVGGTGEGKTQLAHDLIGYLGDNSCYMMGRPDFEPSELLRQVRLDKLNKVKSDKELVELTQNVKKILFYSDEINRAPPIVQNYFFDFMDGKFVYNGKIYSLGSRGYTLGYATGNLGNDEYVGVSDSDRALLDRMHMIIKLDYPDFSTTELDDYEIFGGKKDPRASLPNIVTDISQEIVSMHDEFNKIEVNLLLPVLGVYFHKGLDYLENTAKHSKRALNHHWAEAEGVRTDNDENKIYPLSKRAIFSSICLTTALDLIAREKGEKPDTTRLFLDSLRLIVPYSGVINLSYINMEHDGDVYSAFDSIFSRIREDISERIELLEEACILAESGRKDDRLFNKISPYEGRWDSVKNSLSMYADKMANNPSKKGLKIKDFLDKAHD